MKFQYLSEDEKLIAAQTLRVEQEGNGQKIEPVELAREVNKASIELHSPS